jgi:mannosyl-oligosaccharide glucosidase
MESHWNESMYWGTYRPNLYFGMRTRDADAMQLGLMWFGLGSPHDWQKIRHACDMGDEMASYGWNRHDGRHFGEQELRDDRNNITLHTRLLKREGGSHGAHILTSLLTR